MLCIDDPRPISTLISTNDRSNVGTLRDENGSGEVLKEIPYCIISDEIDVEGSSFQILLYPRGRFVRETGNDVIISEQQPASAYLRYLPKRYGDEIDISWKLQLYSKLSENDTTTLSVSTSGGLPRSNTTWSAGMTFCNELESVESVGRTTDWGSSIWKANEVCNALDTLYAEGEITVFDKRRGESSFGLPLFQKGAVGAVLSSAANADSRQRGVQRDYRVGEVIVPTNVRGLETQVNALKEQFVYPGIDGDEDIKLMDNNNVNIGDENAVGPDRSLCEDEPLHMIDKLLETGKGKDIEKLGDDEVYVLGDCSAVSVDSRVFGTLPKDNIIGRPIARIWPLNRLSGPHF